MPLSWRQLASLLGPPGPMPPVAMAMANPQANEKRILLRAPQALTITRMDAVLIGGTNPSVTISLRHGSDISAAGTAVTTDPITVTSTTTGTAITSLLSTALSAGHWLWLDITASSGSPVGLTVCVQLS